MDLEIPHPGVVLIGENGQGKTNFLEAIYYLVLFRSLRGAADRELVRFGEGGFFLGAVTAPGRHEGASSEAIGHSAGGASRRVSAGYEVATRRKKVTVEGTETTRLADAVGQILAVPFAPADVALVAGGPSVRRRYVDVVLSISEPEYLSRLTQLKAALKQRNAALRRGRADDARAFDEPLATAAWRVTAVRQRWVEAWRGRFAELCGALGEKATAEIYYRAESGAIADNADTWCRRLGDALERDLRRGATSVGPHRHDLRLTLGGRDLRVFGSAGQQRTAAIALRMLEAETLRATRGSAPIALYDDVFAELDERRQGRLLELIGEVLPGQAIVAAPRDGEVPAALLDRPRWQVTGGQIAR